MNIERKNMTRRKIRTAVVSVCASVVLLGTTTFAWFTLTNQARIAELSLTAGTVGGLKIGPTAQEVSFNDLELTSDDNGVSYCVRPITTVDGVTFYKPTYSVGGKVNGTEGTAANISTISNKTEGQGGYMLTYDFYLLAESESIHSDVGIRLASKAAITSEAKGTDVTLKDNNVDGAATAIRMSFTVQNGNDSTTTIYEPNADVHVNKSDKGQYAMANWDKISRIVQTGKDQNKLFANGISNEQDTTKLTFTESVSPELFKIPINIPTKVTMNIWLEGADEDCINDIKGNELLANIVFACTDLD